MRPRNRITQSPFGAAARIFHAARFRPERAHRSPRTQHARARASHPGAQASAHTESPDRGAEIQARANASQVLFARFLNVSANMVRGWEQGTRRPRGADLKLLSIAKKNPQALLSA